MLRIICILSFFYLYGCVHSGIIINEEKEKEETIFSIYPFKVLSSNEKNKEIKLTMNLKCKGFTSCSSSVSNLTIIHEGRFSFLKDKKIFLRNRKEMIDLTRNVMLTHEMNHFETAKDGTTGVLIEKANIEIKNDRLNQWNSFDPIELIIDQYEFVLPNPQKEIWYSIINKQKLDDYLRRNQKAKYISKNEVQNLPGKSSVREAEIETWEMVKESNKKEDYEFFLKHYPNSEYAIPAKLKIQQMKKE